MTTRNILQIFAAVLMLAAAAVLSWRFLRRGTGVSDEAFFYDLSEKKLFTARRTSVPPIRGINDAAEDGMRAVVFSTSGNPRDKSSWKIAYLERYSAELKAQMEAAQATGGSPQMGRAQAQSHRFVRRLSEDEWFPMSSPTAEEIVNEWTVAGPGGSVPVVCTP